MPEPASFHSTRWLTAMTIDSDRFGSDLEGLISHLADGRIEARRVWKPMHRQPLFKRAAYWPHHATRSVSDRLFETGVCLPSGSNLDPEQQDRVVQRIRERSRPSNRSWSSSTLSLG